MQTAMLTRTPVANLHLLGNPRLVSPRGLSARRRLRHTLCRAEQAPTSEQEQAPAVSAAPAEAPTNGSSPTPAEAASNGAAAAAAGAGEGVVVSEELVYRAPTSGDKFWTNTKLFFALPWRRFKQDSVLVIKLEGAITEQPQSRFSSTLALPTLCQALIKAAYDPRIVGVVVKIDPLAAGWGKLQELRRHVEMFNASGKFSIAYMERAGEKEYYLASAFKELYLPPSGYLSLRGFTVGGTFLRGVLDKVGVEPEVKRIGKFKSAGDQLLRRDMSDAQREQLTALLDDIYEDFVTCVARGRGKTREEVVAMLDEGIYKTEKFATEGWVTALKYEDEINDQLKPLTGGKEDQVAKVPLSKYAKVNPSAFNLTGRKSVAVIRAAGAIVGGKGSGSGGTITAPDVIAQLRRAKEDKRVEAVVLRVDSGGGDALASDLMWREIKQLSEKKPVIASMSDVAASGGYYMSMAASKVVAEALTVTGSIGVVTGKFNLTDLYQRVGYNKELISRGRYAQLLSESKPLSAEEEVLFDASAEYAYKSFRDKAAASRGMIPEAMQEVAQGRVWSGRRAAELGLVDVVGGFNRAVALAKEAAGIPADQAVRLQEYSRAKTSPLALLSGGGASASASPSLLAMGWLLLQAVAGLQPGAAGASAAASSAAGAPALLGAVLQQLSGAGGVAGSMALAEQQVAGASGAALGMGGRGSVQAVMPADVSVEGVGSAALLAAAQAQSGGMLGGSSLSSGSGLGLFDC